MFYKCFVMVLLLITYLFSQEIQLEYDGISMKTIDPKGHHVYTIVKRDIPKECEKFPIDNKMLWTGNYAHAKVPESCKSTYVHTVGGHLLPIYIDEDVITYGELEVLAFMKEMKTDDSMMLVDVCREEFYEYRTIPGAVNIPFYHIKERSSFEFEFEQHMKTLGVSIDDEDNSLDFTKAKTITIFCNGPWCSLSWTTIEVLLDLGYPPERIKWYRGGMQEWLAMGMTSTRK